MTTKAALQTFVVGLKHRQEDLRFKTAIELHHFVVTELREMPQDEVATFMDEFNHHIFEMVSSSDVNERKGGVLAIVSLLGGDVGNIGTRVTRFANYLMNLLPSNYYDLGVMEMAAKAVGILALSSGTYASEYVEFEVRRALEWLVSDRNEGRRQASVLILKELAMNTPTFFYQQVQQFFDSIFFAVRDSKPSIREGAVAALRAALSVTSQRETKASQRSVYKQCFEEALSPFDESMARDKKMSRDDWMHGSLLTINELLRCSNNEAERLRLEIEEITSEQVHYEKTARDVGNRTRSLNCVSALQQIQQKSSPLYVFCPGAKDSQQKIPPFESKTCKDLMMGSFDRICNLMLAHRTSRSVYVQQTLLSSLPRLAAFNPTIFSRMIPPRKDRRFLQETINFLLSILKRERERSQAFLALGFLAIAVQGEIISYMSRIMDIIRSSLPSRDGSTKKNRNLVVDPAVFTCISMLARAMGPQMTHDVKELLESMLATGLSPALTAALRELAIQIPQLKKDIQDGLLKNLSMILMGQPLRHPGAQTIPAPLIPAPPINDPSDVTNVTLALRTLGSFDFEGHSLTQFVRHCAEHYLGSEHKEIRMEAVITCARLLSPLLKLLLQQQGHVSMTAMTTVAEVLNKLLVVGITDSDADIRYCVLTSLDERFDPHLAQAENLSALFIALNDEAFEIREQAICMIGRLSSKNPAYVMPSLRKVLIQILTELEHSGMGRNKEQAAKMLGHLISNTSRLIKPYMVPIMNALIPKLKEADQSPGVIISVLHAIGEQAQVSGVEISRWMDQLLPIILEMLQDSSSLQKREVALWTLGQLVESTGSVVTPYTMYPNLLEVLLNFLKTEQSISIRREVIRVLGVLGALDPHKHRMNLGVIKESETGVSKSEKKAGSQDAANGEVNMSELMSQCSTLEEFYPAIAIHLLMKIIRDPSLSQHHNMVVQAITIIFKSLNIKCVPYIQTVIPAYLTVFRTADPSFREFLFQQLGVIIAIVKQHIKNYLEDIFYLIKHYWSPSTTMQSAIIILIEQIVNALGTEFRMYLPQIVPQILRVFMHDLSEDKIVTAKLLKALELFDGNLDDYLHLLLPPVVKLFDNPENPIHIRRSALETIDRLTDSLDLSDYASRIIHPLVRTMDTTPALHITCMDTLCTLVIQLSHKFTIFIPMVTKVMHRHRITHQRFHMLMARILKGTTIAEEEDDPILMKKERLDQLKKKGKDRQDYQPDTTGIKKLSVNFDTIKRALETGRRVSKEDWMEWLRKLSIELLKESPSPALRSCLVLAQTYTGLARDLFNSAFLACWTELTELQQDEVIASLEKTLVSQEIPEIMQTLLNLAEFMEHCDKGPLPLESHLLGERAMKCRAYAKALHYKEDEFHKGPNTQILESLISINNKLQQREAAKGVLFYAQWHKHANLKVQESWYEKLHEWERALQAYQRKQEQNKDDDSLTLARMRCLEAMGDWHQLHQIALERWPVVSDEIRTGMARMASVAAWGLGQWDSVEQYTTFIPRTSHDAAFFRAVFALHSDNFSLAQQCIDKARDILDTELTAMAGESYNRAYGGCQRVVEDWQKILQVRSLVISPEEDMDAWLKYASLCRKNDRLALSHKTLVTLLGVDPARQPDHMVPTTHPKVTFAYFKHMWLDNHKREAYSKLQHFVRQSLPTKSLQIMGADETAQRAKLNQLTARCYLRLGQWSEELHGISEESIPQIIDFYNLAKEHDDTWYKAWHALALMNYEAVLFYKQKEQAATASSTNATPEGGIDPVRVITMSPRPESNSAKIQKYCIPAVHGFFKSIALSSLNSLQDTLRLLTLWFDYGQWSEVYDIMGEGIKSIQIDNWLQVIPQLIARIDTPRLLVQRLVHQLLVDIGKAHPQALIYPLTVASKSNVALRQAAANKILKTMCERGQTLVAQAMLVSEELIRVAILWHELWHEGLEEASRLYFSDRNVRGMFQTLEPLHAMIERGPQTLKETSFIQAYGRDLMEAQDWCRKYQRSGVVKDLTQAWDLYYHVFRRISKQLPQLTSLELQYVSPELLHCRDLELAVPGSYVPNQPVISIQRVQSSLQVITSKQRPRKLSIFGSDGEEYQFLLKGHEDLRQDERVMQLFGLVNSLLRNNPDTFRRNLTITRFAAIPLSTNSGLIGWVPNCDTIHSLIRDYREKRKILLNIEHRVMLRMAQDYDHLTLMQKVEVFEHALEHTQGDDLARILWYKSPSSEVWFDRRTNYTRSLAVMSMVGYVLGLGDRHPSNLMLDRISGKIIHIDFGDCFEVAMVREKYPEKIPFRLTRMLINAMEVTGIDGNYRMTCEKVMSVLRENKESLMAVLEAFVYDPLLSWRLVDAHKTKVGGKGGGKSATATASSINEHHDGSTSGDLMENLDGSQVSGAGAGTGKKPALAEAGDPGEELNNVAPEITSKKAISIVNRVRDKLTGRDFSSENPTLVKDQVKSLIQQATSHENLCQCYIGWCPFW
ncbi:mechanistic target of rapamycin (serine/threonine kinase) [Plakobranchus ocellatus]|uniref:non-specific serine/threonine protein kinase n=1 Tax=Plakobranchus ocellatus TaxID=259542 RepID=A0AAV3Y2R3_9GAST|nr:mechanistic target of rapamycin (serine/threonine kinase) [Plakobranchus ocellatus]